MRHKFMPLRKSKQQASTSKAFLHVPISKYLPIHPDRLNNFLLNKSGPQSVGGF